MVTDEQLLRQVAAGQAASLEALIYRYHKPIYLYLQRMLGDAALAEDLTQECFLRLCQAVTTGRLPEHCRPWLYHIASNLCKDVWKSSAYRRESLTDHATLSLHSDSETVTSILDRQWERDMVVRAIHSLKVEEKQLVILRFYQDLTLREMSEIIGVPLSTVKSRLYQSYRKLAHYIQREEERGDGKTKRSGAAE